MTPPTAPPPGAEILARFLRDIDQHRPGDLARLVVAEAETAWGATAVALHLATHEQSDLVPVRGSTVVRQGVVPLDDGPAARCFDEALPVVDGATLWVPVRHGADVLGVLEVVAPGAWGADDVAAAALLGRGVGQAVATERRYGDDLETVRRTQEMSLGAELLWSVLPPLSCTTAGVSLAVMLEPAYSTGGDAFDYAVNGDVVHVLVLDAMGHGFPAASLSTVAVAAYRHCRRAGLDLPETVRAMDSLVGGQFETAFATAVLVELDVTTGRLTWVSAGHPAPLVARHGGAVDILAVDPSPPLGVGAGLGVPVVMEDFLEPGDVLALYTDGVTEAHRLDGSMVGEGGLADLVHAAARPDRPVTQVVRRLRAALLGAEDSWLSDDVTVLLLRWQPSPVE